MEMTAEQVWREYQEGISFCESIGLFDTVRNNENFFIGKQWEGVEAKGLPTPVFNFIRRIVLYLVATTAADNIKLNASLLRKDGVGELMCKAINGEFENIFEQNRMGLLIREFARNAAVDGDGCLYSYFDPEMPCAGGMGGIRTEIVENSRVFFGNPNVRETERQPYIILARRETVGKLQKRATAFDAEPGSIVPDGEQATAEVRTPTVAEDNTGKVTAALGKSGQIAVYTLDGSDPRFSPTAKELPTAGVTGTKGQTIKVAAKDPTSGFTSAGVAEHVFTK